MPQAKKRRVAVDIEDKTFTALRKLLFAHGVKIGEFFNCIAEKACTNEEIVLKLIEDTVLHKQEKVDGGEMVRGVDAKLLYQMIEKENNRKMK